MKKSEIIKVQGNIELGIKRFYIPVKIKKQCPECGNNCDVDLDENYLSYPEINGKESVYFYCTNCKCEFKTYVILQLSLEVDKECYKL